MNQKDKDLLLQDLCARLPFGVICSIYRIDDWNVGWRDEKLNGYFYNGSAYEFYFGESPISIDNDISKIKPYLRSMSSMTEEEKKEISVLLNYEFYIDDDYALVAEDDRHRIRLDLIQIYIDWLDANKFDYRGLIPMGLALEALKGMYV